uniref:Uncharacterized protein n=1 Tax=Mycena chlorophos TaxID=658473 RepID=A0ABQ0L7Y8_MYCCL|nr:predicted protein [Mycena chlorophos]
MPKATAAKRATRWKSTNQPDSPPSIPRPFRATNRKRPRAARRSSARRTAAPTQRQTANGVSNGPPAAEKLTARREALLQRIRARLEGASTQVETDTGAADTTGLAFSTTRDATDPGVSSPLSKPLRETTSPRPFPSLASNQSIFCAEFSDSESEESAQHNATCVPERLKEELRSAVAERRAFDAQALSKVEFPPSQRMAHTAIMQQGQLARKARHAIEKLVWKVPREIRTKLQDHKKRIAEQENRVTLMHQERCAAHSLEATLYWLVQDFKRMHRQHTLRWVASCARARAVGVEWRLAPHLEPTASYDVVVEAAIRGQLAIGLVRGTADVDKTRALRAETREEELLTQLWATYLADAQELELREMAT